MSKTQLVAFRLPAAAKAAAIKAAQGEGRLLSDWLRRAVTAALPKRRAAKRKKL
jgi:hypothetical protein